MKIWSAMSVVLTVTLVLIGCSDPEMAAQLKTAKASLTALEADNAKMKEDIENLDIGLANVKQMVDTANSRFSLEVENVKTSAAKLDTDLRELSQIKTRLVAAEQDLNKLRSELQNAKAFSRNASQLTPSPAVSTGNTQKIGSYYDVSSNERPEQPSNLAMYEVRKGDTLGSIAKKFGVSVSELQKVNGLRATNLRIGQKLKIPVK